MDAALTLPLPLTGQRCVIRAMLSRGTTVLALGCLVVACGANVTHVRGPDGSDEWLVITCHGSSADCYEAAGEECPDGYQVADQHDWNAGSVTFATQQGQAQGTATGNGSFANYHGTYSGTSQPDQNNTLLGVTY